MAPPTPSQEGASQTTKTQLGVIPQESPDQSQAQSDTIEVKPPQLEDISEGELPDSDSDQEDHSGTAVLEELLMRQEEIEDYDSLNSSPVINKTPLWRFTEQTPSGSQAQTRTNTATSQAQPATSTLAKPAVPQTKAPAQAPVGPPAPAQPVRQAPACFPQPKATPPWRVICVPSESLAEDRLSDFPENKASLIAKQAWSEYLDRVTAYCELERGDPEEKRRVMGMQRPLYHNPSRATINLTLPWHCITGAIADLNLKIVNGHINKRMMTSRPAKPWGFNDFFTGSGYPTHNLEGL